MKKLDIKLNVDPQKILSWAKGNIVLVVLIVACITAGVGLPMLASSQRTAVEQRLKERAASFQKLDSLEKTTVVSPAGGAPEQHVVNRQLVEEYLQIAEAMRDDAKDVHDLSLSLNSKDYDVILAGPDLLFPDPSRRALETLPQQFHRTLSGRFRALIPQLRAGMPPSDEELIKTLEDARIRFMENMLTRSPDAPITADQRSQLESFLAEHRMTVLRNRAESIGVYLDELVLDIPKFDIRAIPQLGTLFNWQWRYWVIADTLGAVAAANIDQTELTAPVKRVLAISVAGLPVPAKGVAVSKPTKEEDPIDYGPDRGPTPGGILTAPGDTEPGFSDPTPTPPASRGRGRGGGSRGGGRGGSTDLAEGMVPALSGRVPGTLQDMLQVRLSMVVSTSRVPVVLDAFAQQNFMTIIDLDLRPVDKFSHLAAGYDYGPKPVSELTLVLETAWLRAWTTEHMPASIKTALGIASTGGAVQQ